MIEEFWNDVEAEVEHEEELERVKLAMDAETDTQALHVLRVRFQAASCFLDARRSLANLLEQRNNDRWQAQETERQAGLQTAAGRAVVERCLALNRQTESKEEQLKAGLWPPMRPVPCASPLFESDEEDDLLEHGGDPREFETVRRQERQDPAFLPDLLHDDDEILAHEAKEDVDEEEANLEDYWPGVRKMPDFLTPNEPASRPASELLGGTPEAATRFVEENEVSFFFDCVFVLVCKMFSQEHKAQLWLTTRGIRRCVHAQHTRREDKRREVSHDLNERQGRQERAENPESKGRSSLTSSRSKFHNMCLGIEGAHLDLSLENVLVISDGSVRLIDSALSREFDSV